MYSSSTPGSYDIPLTGYSDVGPGAENPAAFFNTVLGSSADKKRVGRLVHIVHGFCRSGGISDESTTRFMDAWSRIFLSGTAVTTDVVEGSIPIPSSWDASIGQRLRRLRRARQNVGGEKRNWEYRRLWQLLLAHEVEHISQSEHVKLYTARGVGALTVALKMAEAYLESVHEDYKKALVMVQVMAEGGPASLLQDGNAPPST